MWREATMRTFITIGLAAVLGLVAVQDAVDAVPETEVT